MMHEYCRSTLHKRREANYRAGPTVNTRLKVPGAFDRKISRASIPLSASVTV